MTNTIIEIILMIVSIILLVNICKGRSWDYKTRIRVYCAIYHNESLYIDTKKKNVEQYIEDMCRGYSMYGKKGFKIKIKYMSKLKYSLTKEL